MEPLLAQLQTLPQKLLLLPAKTKALLAAAVIVGVAVVAAARIGVDQGRWEYVFTRLSPIDSAACADALKAAGVPFRIEANGEAIAVPDGKVHDARLLLAGQGLPHEGGVGFELFDKSDLGVSEFTQRVNLQRATEGELARTVQSLAPVREARVHLTLPKKGLFRDDDKQAQAAVMLKLHAGRVLDDAALMGIRNLVAAAVPGLQANSVSIVDDSGTLLGDTSGNTGLTAQKKIEHSLEERIVAVLEPTVGRAAVVARVTADVDDADEGVVRSDFDPERVVMKSERTRSDDKNDKNGVASALIGAAANAVVEEPGYVPPTEKTSQQTRAESTRTWEVSGTVTHRTVRSPRLQRLSVAIVVDEKTPRTPEEVARLRDLAKRAVGFDEDRGDLLELSSMPFIKEEVPADLAVDAPPVVAGLPTWWPVAAGGAVGVLALLFAVAFMRGKKKNQELALAVAQTAQTAAAAGTAGTTGTTTTTTAEVAPAPSLPPPPPTARDRATLLALADPRRAAQVLEGWLEAPVETPLPRAPATAMSSSQAEAPNG